MNFKISNFVKLSIAGIGLSFAGSALAVTVNDGGSGDGDVLLVVFDQTAGTSYVEDLGITTGAVESDLAVNTAATTATGGVLSTALPGYSATFAADSTLSSYLTTHSSDQYVFEVVANSQTSNSIASNILLTTAKTPVSATFTDSTGGGQSGAGGTVDSNAITLQGDIDIYLSNNVFTANGVNARSSAISAFGTAAYLPGEPQDAGALTWYGNGDLIPAVSFKPSSGSSVSNFYLSTDSASSNGLADIFKLGTVTLAANGALTFAAAPVPLPAAVWLFGSGLLGVAGVRRRRAASAAV
jgi:hypothetical protein